MPELCQVSRSDCAFAMRAWRAAISSRMVIAQSVGSGGGRLCAGALKPRGSSAAAIEADGKQGERGDAEVGQRARVRARSRHQARALGFPVEAPMGAEVALQRGMQVVL